MKTKKLGKKLVLNKKTVANLNKDEIKSLKGGWAMCYDKGSCTTSCPGC